MNRFLYFAGFAFIALCGAVLARRSVSESVGPRIRAFDSARVVPAQPPVARTSGAQWFAAVKQYCNPVEVDVRLRYSQPPNTSEGAGYAAACFALAGKVDRARSIILDMPSADRASAANVLFEVAHPVADAGDDRASGPMMELVLEYWPNNYMALYHAGMSAYSLGETGLAEKHLRAFLQVYSVADGFHENAVKTLRVIGQLHSGGVTLVKPRQVERDSSARP